MSATISRPAPGRWLTILLSGAPHQIITDAHGRLYLRRWYLLPHNRLVNLYLHQFLASDDPHDFHDHPWGFVSIMLSGSYVETTPAGSWLRRRGSMALRNASDRHRIALLQADDGSEKPCRTIVVTGNHCRQWGFWRAAPGCEPGEGHFVPWREYGGPAAAATALYRQAPPVAGARRRAQRVDALKRLRQRKMKMR